MHVSEGRVGLAVVALMCASARVAKRGRTRNFRRKEAMVQNFKCDENKIPTPFYNVLTRSASTITHMWADRAKGCVQLPVTSDRSILRRHRLM